MATQTVKMYIAIYQGNAFKHWAVFVEDNVNSDKGLILQVLGATGHWRYERRLVDLTKSDAFLRKVEVASILKTDIGYLRRNARDLPFGESAAWNCQDWVLDLIKVAREDDLIKIDNRKLHSLFLMQEGLVRK